MPGTGRPSSIFIPHCHLSSAERKAPLVALSFYSVDIPAGGNPEFLIKCKALHIGADILDGWRLQSLQCSPPRESEPGAENRDDICRGSGNVCYFLNIILDCLALFQMYVQTMYTEERTRQRHSCLRLNEAACAGQI